MEYIAPQHFPGSMTDTAACVLQTVSRAGVWMPATSDLNGDQLRALLFLRNSGYIEYASFGGYKIKGNQHTVARASQPDAVLTDAIDRITVCKPKNAVMVVMRDGRAHTFKATRWEYLAGLVALAKSFGAPEVRRLQNGLEVYRNKRVA